MKGIFVRPVPLLTSHSLYLYGIGIVFDYYVVQNACNSNIFPTAIVTEMLSGSQIVAT